MIKTRKMSATIIATALMVGIIATPVFADTITEAEKGYKSGIEYLKAARNTMNTAAAERDRQAEEGIKAAQANLDAAFATISTASSDRDRQASEGMKKAQANLDTAYATTVSAQATTNNQARAGMLSGMQEYARIARQNLASCKDLAKANPAFNAWVAQAEAALAQIEDQIANY